MADIIGIANYIQKQGDEGRQMGVNRLLGRAYNAPPDQQQAMLGQVAANGDPGLALEAGKSFDEQNVRTHADLAQRAKLVVGMFQAGSPMAQQAYAAMIPIAQRAGYPIDASHAQLTPDMIPGLTKLASALSPQTEMPGSYKEFQLAQGNPEYGKFLAGQQPKQLSSIPITAPDGRTGTMPVWVDQRTKQLFDMQGNQVNPDGSPAQGASQAPSPAQGAMPPPQGSPSMQGPPPQQDAPINMTVNPGANVPASDEAAMFAAAQNPDAVMYPQANGGTHGVVGQQVASAAQGPSVGVKWDKVDPGEVGKRLQQVNDLRKSGQQISDADAAYFVKNNKWPDDGQDAAGLSDAAIDNAATRYNITGIIPPLGMGQAAAAQRSRILDRAAALAGGQSASDLALQPADYKNSQATLKGLQQSSAGMSRATGALHANAKLLIAASEKALGGSLTGSRIENEARLAWGRQSNDPDIAAYDQYVQTVANEYAKIMGGAPGSNAAATEGARADAERAIHKASSPEALRSTIDSLYHEAENFRNANDAEIARLRSTLTGAKPAANADSTQQHPTVGWSVKRVK